MGEFVAMVLPPLSFDEWAARLGPEVTKDAIWRSFAYRTSLYSVYLGWDDIVALGRSHLTRPIAAQLYRALGSVPANISEGFSRSSGRDRSRLLEYGLGSTRESVVWYQTAIPVLGQATVSTRQARLQEVARSLLGTIPRERGRRIGEV
jgi:four helix bundle protein